MTLPNSGIALKLNLLPLKQVTIESVSECPANDRRAMPVLFPHKYQLKHMVSLCDDDA
jgi:hypothetical protein